MSASGLYPRPEKENPVKVKTGKGDGKSCPCGASAPPLSPKPFNSPKPPTVAPSTAPPTPGHMLPRTCGAPTAPSPPSPPSPPSTATKARGAVINIEIDDSSDAGDLSTDSTVDAVFCDDQYAASIDADTQIPCSPLVRGGEEPVGLPIDDDDDDVARCTPAAGRATAITTFAARTREKCTCLLWNWKL